MISLSREAMDRYRFVSQSACLVGQRSEISSVRGPEVRRKSFRSGLSLKKRSELREVG